MIIVEHTEFADRMLFWRQWLHAARLQESRI